MKRRFKGSMTVEASYLVPIILVMFLLIMYAIFYYHDKNIMTGAAYEVAVVGTQKMREDDSYDVEELSAVYEERIRGKCILFTEFVPECFCEGQQITVEVRAVRGKLKLHAKASAYVAEPERAIYRVKKWKEIAGQ